MDDFEKLLTDLPKPEVKALRHQDMLADKLIRTKDKASMSLWWLLLPPYIVAMLAMKTYYKKTSLTQELWAFHERQPFLSTLLFSAPLILLVFNIFLKKQVAFRIVLFRRKGIFFIPVHTGGWIIFSSALCYAMYKAYDLNMHEHSVSDFLINIVFSLLFITALYSLIAYLTLKKKS